MTFQLFDGMQWWTPIPWILAAIGIVIAVLALRRGRYPSVRFLRLSVECYGRHPNWDYHQYFRLDLMSVGSDIFDLEVYLECDHSYRQRGQYVEIVRKSKFNPIDPLPNPFKNGQVVRFELGDHDFRNLEARKYADTRVPSQLSRGRVRIAIYHSGHRLLTTRSSWRFRSLLRQFDSLCNETVPTVKQSIANAK